MHLYAFELGRKKELCTAELLSVLGKNNFVEKNLDTAVFRLADFDFQKLQNQLGGTIKIVRIFAEVEKGDLPSLKPVLEKFLLTNFQNQSGNKIPFAISVLSYMNTRAINIKELLNFSKKILKSLNLNSRFVNQNFQSPKPSTIYKARVVEKGVDITIIQGTKKVFVGETVSIQNIDNYSKRDYDKPKKDARVGMMPPKLAQIMINLAGPGTKTIYDPFCGTGTTLMEGLLMGKNVVGSDIESRMSEFTKENCEWLEKEFHTKTKFRVFTRDARFVSPKLVPEKIDAVITEGYLGNPVSKLPTDIERERTFRELANLHLNWLHAINQTTPRNCKVVMCITAFKHPKRLEHLPQFPELAKTAGYRVEKLFTYDRPDQVVARDIAVLSKV